MDRNNKGKAVLIESDNNFPVGPSTLVLHDDERSFQDIVTSFENCCHPCKVISEDDEVGTNLRSLDGSCAYLVKPMRDLNMHMNLKRKNDLAQVVQQRTNNVSRVKKPRMCWKPLVHEKFVESVQELGDIGKATPAKILERLKIKGFEHLTRDQKYRSKLQKDKDGTSSEHVHEMEEYPTETLFNLLLHVEANPCTIGGQPSVEDFPPLQDDFFDGLPNNDTRVQQQTNKEARKRMKWTPELEIIFLEALEKLNIDKAEPKEILKFIKASRVAPKDLTRDHISSHLQKIRLKVKRGEDALRDEIMNPKDHLDLSSPPQQLATPAGNMFLQPSVGTQVLQNIGLPLSSGTIEDTIMQDQALVANVAGVFNNTSLPSSSQYKAVDANETAMPDNASNYITRLESPDEILNSLVNNFWSSSPDCAW